MILGKMVTIDAQFYPKFEQGYTEFELQLIKHDTDFYEIKKFIDKTMALGCDYPNVHAHLMGNASDAPAVLDARKFKQGTELQVFDALVELSFKVTDYIATKRGKPTNLVFHRCIPMIEQDDYAYLERLLRKYPNTHLLLETSSYGNKVNDTIIIPDKMDVLDFQVALIEKFKGRASMLFDLTHHSIDAKIEHTLLDFGAPVTVVRPLEILRKYGKYIKSVHLAYAFGSGLGKNHGTSFTNIQGGSYILAKVLKTIREETNCESLVLEISETDYANPQNFFELYAQVEHLMGHLDTLGDVRVSDRIIVNTTVTRDDVSLYLVDFTDTGEHFAFKVNKDFKYRKGTRLLGTKVEMVREDEDYFVFTSTDGFWKSIVFEIYNLDSATFKKVV